jgi:soluble lytic murein transglycosylase-like protein
VAWVKSKAKRPLSDGFATMVVEETFNQAIQNRVDPFVMLAVMSVESSFDYTARSGAGAIGLTQVIPKWHMDKMPNAAHVFDPKNNIRVGAEVLGEYMRWYKGDVQKALLQYNGSLHLPSSSYSQKVLATKAQLLMFLESRLL